MLEFHEVTRPYPGLRPFEAWEGEIFFGREEHTNRLLDILQQQRFLAVIGPSGSGKSSLVRAGLLPALPLGSLGTGSDWRIALMRPGNRPMQRLAHALLGSSALGIELVGKESIPTDERHHTADVALIEAELRRGPLGLVEVVKEARVRETGAEPFNLMVLVDQFEEIFTYADAGAHQADESEAFVNLLLATRAVADQRIFVVLTMRTDFLGNCVRFLALPDAINRAQYLTPRLTREQIEKAITGPARLFDGDVEPSLVAEMINAVSNDPDQLPILQHSLARMWGKARGHQSDGLYIGWDEFNKVGGITEALSGHANEILAALSPRGEIEQPLSAQQQAAESLFRAITEQRGGEAGGQTVRRPQSLEQIGQWSGHDWQDFLPVVRAFAQENVNFLNYVGELNADTVVDISHEALIRQWETLRNWVADEARLAGEYRRWRERAEAHVAGNGALLAGADLARAIEWRDGYKQDRFTGWMHRSWKPGAQWASRYSENRDEGFETAFKNVLEFIADSEQVVLRAQKRERRIKWVMVGLTVISLTLMIFAIRFADQAHQQLIGSEAAALWHPLDFSRNDLIINEKRADGLLRLAHSDEAHKRAFLKQLMKAEALAGWFNFQPQPIIRAAVGLNLERRSWFLENLYEIAPENETNHVFRVARALALLELGGNISPEGLIAAIQATQDYYQLQALGQGMATVANKVAEAQATTMTDKFLTAIQASQDADQLDALGQGLVVAAKVAEVQARAMAEKFVAAILASQDDSQLPTLGQGLAALPIKLTEAQAGTLTDKFVAAILATENYAQLDSVGQSLGAVGAKVPEAQAVSMTDKFMDEILGTEKHFQAQALGQGVAAVAANVAEAQAGAISDKFVDTVRATENYGQLQALGDGLAAVAAKVAETPAMAMTDSFVAAIQASRNYYQTQALGQGLAALPVKLTKAQAGP